MATPGAEKIVPKVIIPMADYGHDPTETAIPYSVFTQSGFTVHFATETGSSPRCDARMLTGLTGSLLGANKAAKSAYASMIASSSTEPGSINKPLSWTDPSFSLVPYDLVFLAGGHEKGVRQLIDSEPIHRQLAEYFPLTKRDAEGAGPKRTIAAICHGVQVLAFTPHPSSPTKSIIASCTTTALPASLEQGVFHATRLFLGDYYKTYGSNSKSVQAFVEAGLHDAKQFKTSPHLNPNKPWIVEDQAYRYVSGRFPPDTEMLAKRAVELVWEANGGKP